MREIVIDHPTGEASGLLAIRNRSVLEAHGWDLGFWTCSDEDPVEKALGALGRSADSPDDWELCRLPKARPSLSKKTEDCEAMARWGNHIYIFGSQSGSKPGPLRPRRHFVARFDESRIQGRLDEARVDLEISRGTFRLHRLINDALRESGLELIERGPHEVDRTIRKTRKKGKKLGKKWAARLHEEDWPINIEGVAFRTNGALLVGLRYPVTRDGHPILVEVDGIDRYFFDPPESEPAVTGLWVLADVGSAAEPRGVRAIEEDVEGGCFHVITGSLESDPEQSVLLRDHPEGAEAASRHHRVTLEGASPGPIRTEPVHLAGDETKIEGLAIDTEGSFCYVMDDDKIRLRCIRPR